MSYFLSHVQIIPRQLRRTHATLLLLRLSSPLSYSTNSGIKLRPYQEECLAACLETLQEGKSTRLGVSLPTGSGKTTVFVSLISRLKPPTQNPDATRALIIVNSEDLTRQSAQRVKELLPELKVEIDQGSQNVATGCADVTIATYQSLVRSDRLVKYDPSKTKCIIVDEAHHAASPSYLKILSYFDPNIKYLDQDTLPLDSTRSVPIIGFTATFSRHDGLALGSAFQDIVYHLDVRDMIRDGWLSSVLFTTVQAALNLDEVSLSKGTGDFNAKSLEHVINTETINNLIVKSWIDKASKRKSTLVFCVNKEHLQALTNAFRRAGIDARYVYSKTPEKERRQLIEDYKAGVFPVLCNIGIFTEGTDIPNIDCVVIARPTRSRNLYMQMIGRGLRLSPGKENCHIIDFVDSKSRHEGIICVPTLYGLDPNEMIEEQSPADLERREEQVFRESIKFNISEPKSVTYTDYDNPFDTIGEASGFPHLSRYSSYAWVGIGDNSYVLECLGLGHVKIDSYTENNQVDEKGPIEMYHAHYVEAIKRVDGQMSGLSLSKKSPYMRPRLILKADTLRAAFLGCDKFVQMKVLPGNRAQGLYRYAKWRQTPASENQLKMLKKMKHSQEAKMGQKLESLTKGQAANIITRLKHGAQNRYEKKLREKRDLEAKKARAAELQQRLRPVVTVGPLPKPSPSQATEKRYKLV